MGIVQTCGAEAYKFNLGQRVVGAPWPAETGNGTWQQYVVADEDVLVRRPSLAHCSGLVMHALEVANLLASLPQGTCTASCVHLP